MGELCSLLGLIEGWKPDPSRGDGWEWIVFRNGRFTPKSLYLELAGYRNVSFPHKGIWIPGIKKWRSLFGMLS